MRRFLITTALEETWRNDEPVLFLGEWCRRRSRRQSWASLDSEVLPYHWDDRARLFADYVVLQEFYERLLAGLSVKLNEIHRVDHGVRYWRMLVGLWLGCFVHMLLDRWTSIQQAVRYHDLSGTVVLSGQEESLVPTGMADFPGLFISDEWNHLQYATILREFTGVPRIWQTRQRVAPPVSVEGGAFWRASAKRRMLGRCITRGAAIFSRDHDAFFLSTYLPFRDEMRLSRRFKQVPVPHRSVQPVPAPVVREQRDWVVPGSNRSDFERCARSMIAAQIPTAYLEGYDSIVAQTTQLPWPKKPKLIWTSNAATFDDVFKAWAAEKVECGSPFVVGQHGGHYGVGRWSFVEEHEVAISDRYLSWGWSNPAKPTVIPVGRLGGRRPMRQSSAKLPNALLVSGLAPRYSYYMFSIAIASQWLDYFADQASFVTHLPPDIRAALIVRLYPNDYGWDQVARWRDKFPTLHLDEGRSRIDDLISRSRLYISTYNATTFLESFTMNIPTVMYWNPNHWELREPAIPYFEELARVGIFHDTPESAARHVAEVWADVDAWWGSPSTRDALTRFKERYCRTPTDLVGRLEGALRGVMADTGIQRSPSIQRSIENVQRSIEKGNSL